MDLLNSPILHWVVAGKNGMEMWGFKESEAISNQKGATPDCIVAIHPLHWDFRFPDTKGSGRVRLGAGCQYNPLQMIEAMFTHVCAIETDRDVIVLDFDENSDLVFDPTAAFGESFLSQYGDGEIDDSFEGDGE